MMDVVEIKVDEEDVEEMIELTKNTLLTLKKIAFKHATKLTLNVEEKIRLSRDISYWLLLEYIQRLIRIFIKLDEDWMRDLAVAGGE